MQIWASSKATPTDSLLILLPCLGFKKAPSSVSSEKKTHGGYLSTGGGTLPPWRGGEGSVGPPDPAPANHTCFMVPGPLPPRPVPQALPEAPTLHRCGQRDSWGPNGGPPR